MGGKVVRLYKGDPVELAKKYSSNPVDIAKQWESAGADILHLVDLDATLGIGSNIEIIKKILDEVSIPVEVAGGLRNKSLVLEIAQLSKRIVLGTLAFKDKPLLKLLLSELGAQKIVISVDHKDGETDAVISKKTNSSAPSLLYFLASSTGSPASLIDSKFNPLTTLPFFTSKHGIILLVNVMIFF